MEAAPTPEQLVADLVLLLDMEPRGPDRFQGRRRRGGTGRVYGGQVIAQALAAAEQTVVDERAAHSLHAYFLRGGNAEQPIDYAIQRDFDGQRTSNRRVIACQTGEVILNLTVSFQRPEVEGLHHQSLQMPDVPEPESLEPDFMHRLRRVQEQGAHFHDALIRQGPIDFRSIEVDNWLSPDASPPIARSWMRAPARLPDDPRVHRAVLAYASDLLLLGVSTLPHPSIWGDTTIMRPASLDHGIWFHDSFRADEWLLYVMESPWAGHMRGFTRGQFFTRDGRLVASVAQEGVIRAVGRK